MYTVESKLAELTRQAKEEFNLDIPTPAVHGFAGYTAMADKDDLLFEMLGRQVYGETKPIENAIYLSDKVEESARIGLVLPHEYGHLIDYYLQLKRWGLPALAIKHSGSHGAEWQRIMKILGYDISTVTGPLPLKGATA